MTKDNILNALEHSEEKKARFFEAWKRGVGFVGPELFGPKNLRTAREKNDLKPLRQAVDAWFGGASGGEKQLLGAMVSFYDPEWGEELASRTDDEKSLCGLTFNLDHQEMEILCELLRNYTGWEEA
jgi:hypothetical protein